MLKAVVTLIRASALFFSVKRKKVVFRKTRNKVTQTLGEFRIDIHCVLAPLCSGINIMTLKVGACLFILEKLFVVFLLFQISSG